MTQPILTRGLAVAIVFAALAGTTQLADAGRKCTGSSPCTACRNCHGCAHCAKGGGSCGVCKPKAESWCKND